ncbi:MAG: hypothetical protein Q9162_000360 [Coniocarpon cinnabarinum]
MSTEPLPSHHRALVLESEAEGFRIQQIPTPQPTPGSAIIRILHSTVASYLREIYNGERGYSVPKPLVGGFSAVGRVAALGPDATALEVGQLVYVDCVVRGRDDQDAIFLSAVNEGGTEGSKKLMRDVWRDGNFAEYAKAPLENCIPLDESRLCRSLGYTVEQLSYTSYMLVAFGGLRDIRLEPGETVVISPATGGFGGAGVLVAGAMGARVIAMGRNETELSRLEEHVKSSTSHASIETVKISENEDTNIAALKRFGTIDAILDLSPINAEGSTHLSAALTVLRRNGRCSLMGLLPPSISPWQMVWKNITLKGKFMYERDDMLQFVKMLERGLFPAGAHLVDTKVFGMSEWKEAFDVAAEYTGGGRTVTISPSAH